jgi:acetyl-CoA acetyltransferase
MAQSYPSGEAPCIGRWAAAQAAGRFDREVVPIPVTQKKGPPIIFARDEGVRGESTVGSLSVLKPIIEGGAVTAGNAAQMLHELERRQGRYGTEAMCIGGGRGMAAIFERAA